MMPRVLPKERLRVFFFKNLPQICSLGLGWALIATSNKAKRGTLAPLASAHVGWVSFQEQDCPLPPHVAFHDSLAQVDLSHGTRRLAPLSFLGRSRCLFWPTLQRCTQSFPGVCLLSLPSLEPALGGLSCLNLQMAQT